MVSPCRQISETPHSTAEVDADRQDRTGEPDRERHRTGDRLNEFGQCRAQFRNQFAELPNNPICALPFTP